MTVFFAVDAARDGDAGGAAAADGGKEVDASVLVGTGTGTGTGTVLADGGTSAVDAGRPSRIDRVRPQRPVVVTDAGTARPTETPTSADAGAVARAANARLRIRIGGSFANVVVDGKVEIENKYGGELTLEPGRHTVEVIKPDFGRHRPRTIEVSEAGAIVEVDEGGGRRPVAELRFTIPRPGQEEEVPGWTSP